MPNLDNAKKALRQSKRRFERNKIYRAELHSMRRQVRKLSDEKKAKEVEVMMPKLYKLADKMVTQGIIKKNKAARVKAQAMKMLKQAA